ncbi:MAG: hypothetical protein ACFFD1_00115 [Candidatus Thorarchaeota archaeon]
MPIERNTSGFSALAAGDPLADLDFGNPRKWATFMDDFVAYDLGQAAGNPYTFTQTNCTDSIAGPTGVVVLTLGGADNDSGQLQLTTGPFQTNSKRLFFEAKVKLELASGGTIAANEMVIGLASLQTTTNFMAADGLSMTADDFLGFRKFDGDAALDAIMRENDSESTDDSVWTPVDDTFATLSIYYTGSEARFYVDNVLKATITGSDTVSVVAPVLYIKAGEAKANVLHCDYILVAAER